MLRLLIISLAISAALMTISCDRFEQHLNRSLEEEKSYTRHAMEYHRQHPDQRRGDGVLDSWSQMDYIAVAVAGQNQEGDWASLSDHLPFLKDNLRLDLDGRPYCIVQTPDSIYVVRYLRESTKEPLNCSEDIAHFSVPAIRSGDMEFSGRTDYWIYLLKRTR
jgi:hypothetical protein